MKVHMRALLLCPKSAIEAADQGLSQVAILEAFITEVDIEANLQAYYDALSTEDISVESVDFLGPLADAGRHDLILDDIGLLRSPEHFIIGENAQMQGIFIAGRALVVGAPDGDGNTTAATMPTEEAGRLLHFADILTVQCLCQQLS